MKFSKRNILILSFLCLLTLTLSNGTAKAYYGSLYGGGMYGMGMYGGLYGGGLSGLGMYGGGMYGMGMYGGGMYGMGMYGGGMYGMGMYGGGMYGMGMYGSGMYGMGMYGGMYGSSGISPFGLQNMYFPVDTGTGLSYQVPFLQVAPMLGMAGLYNSLFPSLFNPSTSAGEQAGYWEGLWNNGIYVGPMTFNVVEDPLTLALSGYAQLVTNYSLGVLIPFTGTSLNGQVIVSGTGIGLGSQIFELQIVGLLTSTTTMSGTYTIINVSNGVAVETGSINLALTTPVI